MQFFSTLAALAACVSAYEVLTPTANSTITKGTTIDVLYSTVDTDPSTFSVYLANFVQWPPMVLSLVQDVAQDAGSVSVRIPCSVNSGSGFTLNFINGTNTYVIYAQSPTFSLTGSCVDPTTTSSSAVYSNATSTATVQTVQTIVIPTPVLWFVEPSNLVAAAAICPPSSQTTVTVAALGASTVTVTAAAASAQTVTVASCPSQAAIVAALAAAQGGATTTTTAAAVVAAAASAKASTSGSVTSKSVNGSAIVAAASTKATNATSLPTSTSGASKVGAAAFGLVAVFAVLLL